MLTTVTCMRRDQKLRIFGFNWHPQNWFMHKMSAEQKIIKRLLAGRQVEINPTACDGMYTCEKLCDSLFYRLAKDGDKSTCEERVCSWSLLEITSNPVYVSRCVLCLMNL